MFSVECGVSPLYDWLVVSLRVSKCNNLSQVNVGMKGGTCPISVLVKDRI